METLRRRILEQVLGNFRTREGGIGVRNLRRVTARRAPSTPLGATSFDPAEKWLPAPRRILRTGSGSVVGAACLKSEGRAQQAGREHDGGGDEGQDAMHRDPDDPERQQDQPYERVGDQG